MSWEFISDDRIKQLIIQIKFVMQKTFILALNAAAALAVDPIEFNGVSVVPIYDSVMSETTFSDEDYDFTFNWGSAELKTEDGSAYILAAAFQVGGVDIADGTQISTTASIEDASAPGKYESWTCTVNWTKPERSALGETAADGGIAKTAADATVVYTLTNAQNDPNVVAEPWFGDSNQSGASYSSWYEYAADPPAETTEEADPEAEPTPPAKNSWQLCSAARIIESDVTGLDLVTDSGLTWKMGEAYTVSN